MTDKAWVLWHQYSDKSGAHIERVYLDEKRAREDYALLTDEHPTAGAAGKDSNWILVAVPLFADASSLKFPPGVR